VLLKLTVGATPGLLGKRRPAGVEELVATEAAVAARGCHGTSAPGHASSRAGRPPEAATEGGRSGGRKSLDEQQWQGRRLVTAESA
jgi:hypothetical protein